MEGGGASFGRGDGELRGADELLVGEIVALDPAIEADLAEAGARVGVELAAERGEPVG